MTAPAPPPDRVCRHCGWRAQWYGSGPGRDRDGYRCMRYVDLHMRAGRVPDGQLSLPIPRVDAPAGDAHPQQDGPMEYRALSLAELRAAIECARAAGYRGPGEARGPAANERQAAAQAEMNRRHDRLEADRIAAQDWRAWRADMGADAGDLEEQRLYGDAQH